MTGKQIAALLAAVLFAATAYAGDKSHQKMEIKVVTDDGDGETRLTLDSDDLGFDLQELQVGENRSIVDKEGRTILVTRKEDGFSFDVDGKTIDMPLFAAMGSDHHKDVDVHAGHDGKRHRAMMADGGVMIVSGKEIDAATQQVIRSALESAGHEKVHFAGGRDGGPHEVRMIKKVVEVEK